MELFVLNDVLTKCGHVKATGGGAFRYADLFKEKLGITLDKVDEMDSLVAGANFLLKVGTCMTYAYLTSNSSEKYGPECLVVVTSAVGLYLCHKCPVCSLINIVYTMVSLTFCSSFTGMCSNFSKLMVNALS